MPDLSSPWKQFLGELDALLNEPIEFHCIGGFAVVAGYGLSRSTNDLDYRSLVPNHRIAHLQHMAGPGSALSKKYKVYVQHTGVESMPEDYEQRLKELYPGRFKNIRLFVPDAYDLALSKLTRNEARDREDVEYLIKTGNLSAAVLRQRYEKEMRHNLIGPESTHDLTLELWLEAYFPPVQDER